jgi:surface polysaccharide O-acyltransferase-like enzyme
LTQANISNSKDSEFLGYLHSFRGLAILKIVLGHAVSAAFIGAYTVFDVSNTMLMISEIFYHDSTLYFAIISGILFSKVLKRKGYFKFYKSKLKNILLPYLFFTIVLTIIKIKFSELSSFQEGVQFTISKIWMNFIFGKANFALWYIPVLIFLYLVTPVLEFLQKRNKLTKALFALIIILPLFISRVQNLTDYNLSIETMIYFMGAYALGIYLGDDLNKKLSIINTYKGVFVLIALMSTVILFYFYKNKIDIIGTVSLREMAFYIQKICFAFIIILMFKRLEKNQPKWLNPIARDSFSIYFIHGSILYVISPLFMFVIAAKNIEPFNVILGAMILFVIVTCICVTIVMISKKIFGTYSKMIVGA